MVAAQIRLRAANRALDAAIYADQVSDSDVEARIAEAQAAQAEVAKLRSMNEYAVRKVLTPEQLVHFRELRRKFEEMRKEMQPQRPNRRRSLDIKQPGPNGTPPMRRLIKQGQQRPPLH
jgi:Spy/CpxP family protein refolding chaperone